MGNKSTTADRSGGQPFDKASSARELSNDVDEKNLSSSSIEDGTQPANRSQTEDKLIFVGKKGAEDDDEDLGALQRLSEPKKLLKVVSERSLFSTRETFEMKDLNYDILVLILSEIQTRATVASKEVQESQLELSGHMLKADLQVKAALEVLNAKYSDHKTAETLPSTVRKLNGEIAKTKEEANGVMERIQRVSALLDAVDATVVDLSPPTFLEHDVSPKDTLQGIAVKYKVKVADIKKANKLFDDAALLSLQTLRIPVGGSQASPSRPFVVSALDTNPQETSPAAPAAEKKDEVPQGGKTPQTSPSKRKTTGVTAEFFSMTKL